MEKQLLANETIIASINKGLLVLTDLRLIQQPKGANSRFYKSIYLTDVTSIAVTKKKIDLLLYLTLLSMASGLASLVAEQIVIGVIGKTDAQLSIFFAMAAAFFYLIYSFYGISVISIATCSLQIDQQISSKDDTREFILKVEQAKLAARKTTS